MFNVLSLFDGISCGRIALERADIKVDSYFASEIDKHAIKVTQYNYPDTIQLGDVTKWREWDLPKIDLLIGGSPCQGFSFAGKQLNFSDLRSKLFFTFVDILKELKPEYFLLENVKMKREYKNIISEYLEVEPIEINSSLVSAQDRKRLYWTNIPNITQPEDKHIYLKDTLESRVLENDNLIEIKRRGHGYLPSIQYLTNKTPAVFTTNSDYFVKVKISENNITWRKLTPLEHEKLQTLSVNYTETISSNQRYKCIGNGWTIDIISHIFSFMKKDLETC